MEFAVLRPGTKQVDDITYKVYSDLGYSVYWGTEHIGYAFRPTSSWEGWKACSSLGDCNGIRMVNGFKNRRYATNYLLESHPSLKGSTF